MSRRRKKTKKTHKTRTETPAKTSHPQTAAADPLSPSTPKAEVERQLRAQLAALTGGLAPDDYLNTWWDWYLGVATHPPRQAQLARSAYEKILDSWQFFARAAGGSPVPPGGEELGFSNPAWNVWPFNVYAHSYANWAAWWQQALTRPSTAAATDPQSARLNFAGRLLLEAASPANFLHTNPELLTRTAAESGQNLIRGLKYWLEDARRAVTGNGRSPGTEQFQVGKQVAITPGKVVFRNRLIELLQYAPQTASVYAEPILITPAWIMKYYILDLSPRNSMVRYLVEKGHTVFMVSWKNPDAADRELGIDDYVRLGFLDALAEVRRIVPRHKVHAVGYCIGGTLLAIAAAYLAQEKNAILNSVTLLAAQTDFTEAGELTLFIDDSQLNYLEDLMWEQGYLDTRQMAGAFQLLRSSDLIWSRLVHEYLMGKRAPMNDLMAWNADATRMPYRMHSQYLRRLFLGNDLFEGRYKVDGRPIALADIRVPIFAVATEGDHVAPWHSVYKLNLLSDAEVTFVLTSGGHNAGIVSEPGHAGRHFRISQHAAGTRYVDPETWQAATKVEQGSWWPAWLGWLKQQSRGSRASPPTGAPAKGYPPLAAAPGKYVLEH